MDYYEPSELSLILAWLLAAPTLVFLVVGTPFLVAGVIADDEPGKLERGLAFWIVLCVIVLGPLPYLLLQFIVSEAYSVQSLGALTSWALLFWYAPIIYAVLVLIGVGLPCLPALMIGEGAGRIARTIFAFVAAPLLAWVSRMAVFAILPLCTWSVHWLDGRDLIRAADGPGCVFHEVVVSHLMELPVDEDLKLYATSAESRLRAHIASYYLGSEDRARFKEYAQGSEVAIAGRRVGIERERSTSRSSLTAVPGSAKPDGNGHQEWSALGVSFDWSGPWRADEVADRQSGAGETRLLTLIDGGDSDRIQRSSGASGTWKGRPSSGTVESRNNQGQPAGFRGIALLSVLVNFRCLDLLDLPEAQRGGSLGKVITSSGFCTINGRDAYWYSGYDPAGAGTNTTLTGAVVRVATGDWLTIAAFLPVAEDDHRTFNGLLGGLSFTKPAGSCQADRVHVTEEGFSYVPNPAWQLTPPEETTGLEIQDMDYVIHVYQSYWGALEATSERDDHEMSEGVIFGIKRRDEEFSQLWRELKQSGIADDEDEGWKDVMGRNAYWFTQDYPGRDRSGIDVCIPLSKSKFLMIKEVGPGSYSSLTHKLLWRAIDSIEF